MGAAGLRPRLARKRVTTRRSLLTFHNAVGLAKPLNIRLPSASQTNRPRTSR